MLIMAWPVCVKHWVASMFESWHPFFIKTSLAFALFVTSITSSCNKNHEIELQAQLDESNAKLEILQKQLEATAKVVQSVNNQEQALIPSEQKAKVVIQHEIKEIPICNIPDDVISVLNNTRTSGSNK